MLAASLLTVLALAGVAAGLFMGHVRFLPAHVAAAGGGLLFGLSLFWVVPEVAEDAGQTAAWMMAIAVCGLLLLVDRILLHKGQASKHVIGTLLIATAVHSFLDGWSIRAIAGNPFTNVTVTLGLALHKGPEGLVVGWISRRSIPRLWKAIVASSGVELMTLVGAAVQPVGNRSGLEAFGSGWTAAVLSVIAGSFLFLGVHAVLPNRKRFSVVGAFVAALAVVACASLAKR